MSKPACGVMFQVYYPPFPQEMTCELDREHEGPHQCAGFAWGALDQSQDYYVQAARKAREKRRDRARRWHRLLGGRRADA